MKERRKAQRVQEKAKVTIKLTDSEDELACRVIHHLTQDISLNGVKIRCDVFIPVNSLLNIELSLRKPTRVISVHGKVRWIKALYKDELYEMGIEFVDTSQEAIRLLESCLSELTK
jgi:c-di-GMP-binding flagellar brake protein YcgR